MAAYKNPGESSADDNSADKDATDAGQSDANATAPVPTDSDATAPVEAKAATEDAVAAPPLSDIEQLKIENEKLKAQLAEAQVAITNLASGTITVTRQQRNYKPMRNGIAGVFAFLAPFLLILGIIGSWVNNTALDTDKFVARVGPIIDQPAVQTAVSQKLGQELVSVLNLQAKLEPVLPENIKFLAGPIASGANSFVEQQVTKIVASDQFKQSWDTALKLTQAQVAAALEGKNKNLVVENGQVYINLIVVVNNVLQQLSTQLPTVLGKAITIPTLSSDPASIQQATDIVQKYLGVTLPPNFAQIPIMPESDLVAAQNVVKVVDFSTTLMYVLAALFLILAIWISAVRRRTVFLIGAFLALLTGVVFFALRAISKSALGSISDDTLRPAVQEVTTVVFQSLKSGATWLLVIGVIIAIVAYLVGPGRGPKVLRRWVVQGVAIVNSQSRRAASSNDLRLKTRTYLDPLRIGGVVVVIIILFLWTSWTSLWVMLILLILWEVGITLFARSAKLELEEGPPLDDLGDSGSSDGGGDGDKAVDDAPTDSPDGGDDKTKVGISS